MDLSGTEFESHEPLLDDAVGKLLREAEQRTERATCEHGVLDTVSGVVTFSSAGHPSPVRIERGRAVELVVPPGPPLGVQRCHYKDHEYQLDDGCLVMFTDGLVERRGVFLDDRLALLESSLRSAPTMGPDTVSDFVIDAMTADERSSDDIVVLAARRVPAGARGGPDRAGGGRFVG